MSRSILIIADRREDDRFILEKARNIVSPLDAKLEVVRFLPQLDTQDEFKRKEQIKESKQHLDSMISEVLKDGPQITSQVICTSHIADWVEGTCGQKHFDLVVKTGHRTENIFHTPTDWQLIRQLSCPILIANDHKWKSKPVVMTTVNVSTKEEQHKELNNLALQWTDVWTKAFNCSTHVVYSIPIAKALLELDAVDPRAYEEKRRPEAERQLAELLEQSDLNDVHTHITTGPPEKTIPHVANELKADLVIVGCVGRTGVKRLLFGNTAEKVLHHLRTDILIVEPSKS